MNTQTVATIRATFQAIAPQAEWLIERFYQRLFEGRPQVRAMFPKDMGKQKGHLLAAVGLVVKHADNLGAITPALEEMGARHVGYGAKPEHYALVRDEMLGAMKDVAGTLWTSEAHAAWTEALNAVAGAMIRGAERHEKQRAA